MAASVVADAGFLIALLRRRDGHQTWARQQASRHPPPWRTCEAAVSEAFHLLDPRGASALRQLLRRDALVVAFDLGDNLDGVLRLMEKYADVPASLADACLVRMTETLDNPLVLTTDADFAVYRRHGRQVVPCVRPAD